MTSISIFPPLCSLFNSGKIFYKKYSGLVNQIYLFALSTLSLLAKIFKKDNLAYFLPQSLTSLFSVLSLNQMYMDLRKTYSNAIFCLKVQDRALFFYTALKAAAQAFDILLAVTATIATLIATFISPPLALTIYACTMPLSLASFFWLIVMDITDFCKGKNIKKEIEQNNNIDAIFQEIRNRDKKTPSKLAVRVLCQLHFEVANGANLKKSLDISATIQRDKLALKVLGYASRFFMKALPPFSLARETVYWVNSGLWLAYTIKSTYLTKPS